jgi:hypothetical protein
MSISLNISAAAPISNYAELQDKILKWMDREGDADAIALVPDWIQFAEVMFNRELRTPEMEHTVTFSIADEDTPLPSDFLGMRAIYEETDPDRALSGMSPDQLRLDYGGNSGIPQGYAIIGGGIRVAPVPDQEYIYTLDYIQQIVPLSVIAPSNWMLEKHPDAYLIAALAWGYDWMDNEAKANRYAQLAAGIVDRIKTISNTVRWGAGQRPNPVRQASRGRC